MVEYILLLICVLAIGLGSIWQFNKGFRDYAKGYFVNYIACLLRSGELPSLGAAPAATSAAAAASSASSSSGGSICSSEIQNFKMGDASSALANSGSGSGSGANSSSSAASEAAAAAKNAAGAGGSGGGNGSSSGAAGSDGPGNSSGGYNSRLGNVFANSSASKGKVPLSKADLGSGSAADGFAMSVGRNDLDVISSGGSFSRKGYNGGDSDYIPVEAEAKAAVVPKKVPVNEEDTKKRKSRYTSAERESRALASEDSADEAYSFTNIFRWFAIICIIILMLIFFGGQAARISKSMDKSD